MFGGRLSRRRFLQASFASAVTFGLPRPGHPSDPPGVAAPRATDGDERHQPDWSDRLTITVGTERGDIVGRDDKAIQAAVDYVARLGTGSVRIAPGLYTLRNAIDLPSHVRLVGSGPETILTKVPSVTVSLVEDSDWYDQEVTVASAKGFQVGDGVVLKARDPSGGQVNIIKRTLVARSGNRFKLSDGIRKNLWLSGEPSMSLLFPLLTGENVADVVIENLTLDGNGANNQNLNGNYAGCIFLQDCNRFTLHNVTARRYNGDGISFQVCHDVVVEDCHSHDHTGLGLHPGSGSQRPIMRRNRLERNRIGLYWCWGVKYGLAEDNRMLDNRDYGISIGHNDTDNVMRHNQISGSGKVGILFRDESRGKDFWPNRNTIEANRITNSGGDDGIGIDIRGKTRGIHLTGNEIRELRAPAQRIGIRIGPDATDIRLTDNVIQGCALKIVDQRETG